MSRRRARCTPHEPCLGNRKVTEIVATAQCARIAGEFYKVCVVENSDVTSFVGTGLAGCSGELAKLSSDREPEMIRAFLLQPHVTRMVVGQFNDQHALVFRQR